MIGFHLLWTPCISLVGRLTVFPWSPIWFRASSSACVPGSPWSWSADSSCRKSFGSSSKCSAPPWPRRQLLVPPGPAVACMALRLPTASAGHAWPALPSRHRRVGRLSCLSCVASQSPPAFPPALASTSCGHSSPFLLGTPRKSL